MINRFWLILCAMLLLSGCGWNGTPTRPNDFTKLTSITISAVSPTIANGTSTKLTATGHFSGQFSRDVTDEAVWSSASPAVADFKYSTAPNKNRVTAVATGTAVVTATVDGVSAPYTLAVSNATIQTMTITPANPDPLPKGRSLQFYVLKGTFSDLSTQDMTFDAAWSSDTVAVATVSDDVASKGLAKAIAAVGSATISATFPPAGGTGSISGTQLLIVTNPALDSITVTPANSSMAGLSKTVNFIAKGNYSDGGTAVDITTTATWSSSAIGIANINAGSGVATTVATGTTIISATLNGITGKTNLTVTIPVLSSNGLKITPTNPVVNVGTTQQLTVTATFSDSSTQDVTSSCVWTSSSPTNASVSSTGLVTGGFVGSSIITATYGGQFISVTVTVQ